MDHAELTVRARLAHVVVVQPFGRRVLAAVLTRPEL